MELLNLLLALAVIAVPLLLAGVLVYRNSRRK
jgi:hypothetical protein